MLSLKLQYQSSLLGFTMILICLPITAVIFWLYFDLPIWSKIIMIINALAGMIVISSNIATTYMQYKALNAYMQYKALNQILQAQQKQFGTPNNADIQLSPQSTRLIRYGTSIISVAIGSVLSIFGYKNDFAVIKWIGIILGGLIMAWGLTIFLKTEDFIKSKFKKTKEIEK